MAEAGDLSPGRALDLAAGEGRNAVWLASLGWQVTAVDFSRAGLDRAQRMARDADVTIDAVLADLASYEPPEGAFGLVIIMYLQVPADLMAGVVSRAAQAVAPGGTFLLIGHDADNIAHGYGGPPDPAVLNDADAVVAALGDGLEVESAGRVERVVATDDGERTAIDTLVRAQRPADP